jgi:hypothetical protein
MKISRICGRVDWLVLVMTLFWVNLFFGCYLWELGVEWMVG